MTLKPGPKRIAASTGEPDKRQGKKAGVNKNILKRLAKYLRAAQYADAEVYRQMSLLFPDEYIETDIEKGGTYRVCVGGCEYYLHPNTNKFVVDHSFPSYGELRILAILNKRATQCLLKN